MNSTAPEISTGLPAPELMAVSTKEVSGAESVDEELKEIVQNVDEELEEMPNGFSVSPLLLSPRSIAMESNRFLLPGMIPRDRPWGGILDYTNDRGQNMVPGVTECRMQETHEQLGHAEFSIFVRSEYGTQEIGVRNDDDVISTIYAAMTMHAAGFEIQIQLGSALIVAGTFCQNGIESDASLTLVVDGVSQAVKEHMYNTHQGEVQPPTMRDEEKDLTKCTLDGMFHPGCTEDESVLRSWCPVRRRGAGGTPHKWWSCCQGPSDAGQGALLRESIDLNVSPPEAYDIRNVVGCTPQAGYVGEVYQRCTLQESPGPRMGPPIPHPFD